MYFWTFPVASFTSISISACGFIHWILVTVPFNVVIFDMSYDAAPWCAKMGTETKRRRTTPKAGGPKSLPFMGNLQLPASVSIPPHIVNAIVTGLRNAHGKGKHNAPEMSQRNG